MTPEERSAILARHKPTGLGRWRRCRKCRLPWGEHGCDAYRLGHDIDEERLAVALEDHAADIDAEHGFQDHCGDVCRAAIAAAYREQVR